MNFGGDSYLPGCDDKDAKRYTQFDHSQLDGADEDDSEELAEYEQIYENEGTFEYHLTPPVLKHIK